MERPPKLSFKDFLKAWKQPLPEEMHSLLDKINGNYEYWDKVKYRTSPLPLSNIDLWAIVKADRIKHDILVWNKYDIHFSLTNEMQRQCHEFDMHFGGSWGANSIIPDNHEYYLVSSLMEEAISSSQMEGASTTRKIAKEMLRKKLRPRDRSQQMILNNYQTIRFIVDNKAKQLSKEKLLEIHRLMTEKTLENEDDAGRIRTNNDVVVEDGISHEVVHIPPSYEELPEFIDELCLFFNDNNNGKIFIHPVIKGIIIHFMIAYMHPFVDGNGRTARALFYWYMLKQGYWLTEYLSISRIIYKSKKAYEKSFLYAENDQNDIGYFIAYNLRALSLAFQELENYIKRKADEKKAAASFLQTGAFNERQADIIRIFYSNPEEVLTVKDVQIKFGISPTTAKKDIQALVDKGILSEIAFNKVKKGYIKSPGFDNALQKQFPRLSSSPQNL